MTLTLKHHPIVFSHCEGVPVVCVALDDHYYHKNRGAMDNCGQGEYCLDRESFFGDEGPRIIQRFIERIDALREEISRGVDAGRRQECEALERFLADRAH